MTTDEERLASLARRGRNTVLREDFHAFVHQCFVTVNPATAYLPNWHIALIAEYLEACRRGEIRRLIINLPPRMLKSLTVSVAWPAFLLGHNPAERIMTASYAAGLSVKHALDCRAVMQSGWYREVFPAVRLAKDQNEKHKMATTRHGHRIATSVGGTATGEGGGFLIMDDPHTPAQAMSDAQRRSAIDWFDQTFTSRLDDKRSGCIVVVMQRLHADDLSGHLLSKGGWVHLSLPAIAEKSETLVKGQTSYRRKAGEPLHPKREGLAELQALKREMGSYAFAAQYQQNPMPLEAGMVRQAWFKRYAVPPRQYDRIVQSWDTAVKAGGQHDASVCMTVGETDGVHYVLDVQAVRLEYPALKREIITAAERWRPDAVLLEDKASGQSLLQDLRRERNLPPLLAMTPTQDKVTRFAAVTAMIEAGQVALPQEALWLSEFEREILTFPHGRHDDHVDALSQYLNWIRGQRQGEYVIRPL